MRRKFYGKPLPSKRQLIAHDQFYSMARQAGENEMKITKDERNYLLRMLAADLHTKNSQQLHAASHGSDFYDPDFLIAGNLFDKLEVEPIHDSR